MNQHLRLAVISALLAIPAVVTAQPRLGDIPRAGTGLEVENTYSIPVIFSVDGFDRAEGNRLRTELEIALMELMEARGGLLLLDSPLPYRVHVHVRLAPDSQASTTVTFERKVTFKASRSSEARVYEAAAIMNSARLERPYTRSGVLLDAERLTETLVSSLVPVTSR